MRAIMAPMPVALAGSVNLAGGARALNSEPREVAVASANFFALGVDLGVMRAVDTVALLYVRGGDAAFTAFGGLAGMYEQQLGTAPLLTTQVTGDVRHSVIRLAQPVNVRYLVVHCDSSAPLQLGVMAVGRRFQPQWGAEWGGGVGLVDTGSATRRPDGGFGIDHGALAAQLQWTFGDLSDNERAALFGLLKNRGTTRPALVLEGDDNGPTMSEQVHWGLFTRIEAYERLAPGMSRWSLRFEDWA